MLNDGVGAVAEPSPEAIAYINRETARREILRLLRDLEANVAKYGADHPWGKQCGEWAAQLKWATRGGV